MSKYVYLAPLARPQAALCGHPPSLAGYSLAWPTQQGTATARGDNPWGVALVALGLTAGPSLARGLVSLLGDLLRYLGALPARRSRRRRRARRHASR